MTLQDIFNTLQLSCDKFSHYLPLYEKWFERFVGNAPRILEIGIQYGGSAEMWSKYFGAGTIVHGIDINPRCVETDYLKIHVGNQGSPHFWANFTSTIDGPFDIIIDDGSHENYHQILTLVQAYPLLKDGGVYWCEDTHTSYYSGVRVHGGGLKNATSFVEYAKRLVDVLNWPHTHFAIGVGPTPNGPHVDAELIALFGNTQGIHFYDSIVILEKGPRFRFERVVRQPQ